MTESLDDRNEQPLVRAGRSPNHGLGLFAATDLEEGQLIGVYQGSVVEDDGIYVLWVK